MLQIVLLGVVQEKVFKIILYFYTTTGYSVPHVAIISIYVSIYDRNAAN